MDEHVAGRVTPHHLSDKSRAASAKLPHQWKGGYPEVPTVMGWFPIPSPCTVALAKAVTYVATTRCCNQLWQPWVRRSAATTKCTTPPTQLLFSRQECSQGQDTRRRKQCPGNGPTLATLSRPGTIGSSPHWCQMHLVSNTLRRSPAAVCAWAGAPMKGVQVLTARLDVDIHPSSVNRILGTLSLYTASLCPWSTHLW